MQFIGLDKKYGRSVAPCVSSVPYGLLLVLFGSGGFGGCGGGVVVAEAMVAEKLQTLQRATCALPVLVDVDIRVPGFLTQNSKLIIPWRGRTGGEHLKGRNQQTVCLISHIAK